jgi:hypothetical protein
VSRAMLVKNKQIINDVIIFLLSSHEPFKENIINTIVKPRNPDQKTVSIFSAKKLIELKITFSLKINLNLPRPSKLIQLKYCEIIKLPKITPLVELIIFLKFIALSNKIGKIIRQIIARPLWFIVSNKKYTKYLVRLNSVL